MLVAFIPPFLCTWNQMPWRNLRWVMLLGDFFPYSFVDSTDSKNLLCWRSISAKTVPIFSKNFLDFRSDMSEKQGIINLSSYSNKSYTSVVLWDSEVTFPSKEKDAGFRPFLYCLCTELYNRGRILSIFLVFHCFGSILTSFAALLLLILFFSFVHQVFLRNQSTFDVLLTIINFFWIFINDFKFPNEFLKRSFHFWRPFLGWQLQVLLLTCFLFRPLHFWSAMLIVIVYLQSNFWFYWICPWMYSSCFLFVFFWFVLVNSHWAF